MDYILTKKAIAANQVAVMGSSIGGKIALWAAAQDALLGIVRSATTPPAINSPIIESPIGFHFRLGFHGLQLYDWERFMEFIEYHFLKIAIRNVHDIYYQNGKLVDHYPNKRK